MDNLPYAADAATSLTPAELNILRTQFQREGPKASVQTKFNYAWGLVKSDRRSDQTEGLGLLREIYASTPERARECLYYLALGCYKLGSYADARRYNEILLSIEPKNAQALSLKSLIDERVAKDGFIGMAIVAGLAAAGGILIAGLMKHSKK